MKNIAILLMSASLLAGCSTTSPEQRAAENQGACSSYGFREGTDAYATCMMQMDIEDRADDQRRTQALANGLRQMGQSMQQNRPVTCNTYGNTYRGGYGSTYGNATTTCY